MRRAGAESHSFMKPASQHAPLSVSMGFLSLFGFCLQHFSLPSVLTTPLSQHDPSGNLTVLQPVLTSRSQSRPPHFVGSLHTHLALITPPPGVSFAGSHVPRPLHCFGPFAPSIEQRSHGLHGFSNTGGAWRAHLLLSTETSLPGFLQAMTGVRWLQVRCDHAVRHIYAIDGAITLCSSSHYNTGIQRSNNLRPQAQLQKTPACIQDKKGQALQSLYVQAKG
jgi:hypothetical protein